MRRICCVNLCRTEAEAFEAAALLLADFEDAYAAYEKMSSAADSEPDFEFIKKSKLADAVAVAFDNADALCAQVAKLSAGTQVYGVYLGDALPSQAVMGVDTACKRNDCAWQGSLLIAKDPAKVAVLMTKPRLGWRRRKLSEGIDRLIACARAGISIQAAPELFGATKKQALQAKRNLIIV